MTYGQRFCKNLKREASRLHKEITAAEQRVKIHERNIARYQKRLTLENLLSTDGAGI